MSVNNSLVNRQRESLDIQVRGKAPFDQIRALRDVVCAGNLRIPSAGRRRVREYWQCLRICDVTVNVPMNSVQAVSVCLVVCNNHAYDSVSFLANVRYMLSPVRLSSVCLSVTLVHPTQLAEIFGNVSTPFGTFAIR